MAILIILGTILLIVLVVFGMDKLFHYEQGEPLRHQMLLFWFRKQVVEHENKIERIYNNSVSDFLDIHSESLSKFEAEKLKLMKWKDRKLNYQFFLKPMFLCVKCMPSVWGSLTFIILHGISVDLLPYMFMCDIAAVGIITFIVDHYEIRHS